MRLYTLLKPLSQGIKLCFYSRFGTWWMLAGESVSLRDRLIFKERVFTGEWKVHAAASMLEISEVPW